MKLMLFAIKDLAAQAFGRPMFLPHAGVAVRSFTDEVNRPSQDSSLQNDLFAHPDDFELYELGEFDDSDGSFALHKVPKLLLQGKQVKRSDIPSKPLMAAGFE